MSENKENLEQTEAVNQAAEETKAEKVEVSKVTSKEADEDFDWDAFEGTSLEATGEKKDEMTALYNDTLSVLQEKEVVDGKVISLNKREVVVDIGYKSDGIVFTERIPLQP